MLQIMSQMTFQNDVWNNISIIKPSEAHDKEDYDDLSVGILSIILFVHNRIIFENIWNTLQTLGLCKYDITINMCA